MKPFKLVNGTTVSLGGATGYTFGAISQLNLNGVSRGVIEFVTTDSLGEVQKIPKFNRNNGQLELEIQLDSIGELPIAMAADTLTIQWSDGDEVATGVITVTKKTGDGASEFDGSGAFLGDISISGTADEIVMVRCVIHLGSGMGGDTINTPTSGTTTPPPEE